MSVLAWSPKYNTKIRIIDTDHEGIFDAINALNDAHNAGKVNKSINDMLETLRKSVVEHHKHEEHVLEQAGYPDFTKHRAEHREFTHLLSSLVVFHHKHPDCVDLDKVVDFLGTWQSGHILNSDMDFVPYVRGEKKGLPPPDNLEHTGQSDVHISFTVPVAKAGLIKEFVDCVIGDDMAAENFETAFNLTHKILEEKSLLHVKKMFGLD